MIKVLLNNQRKILINTLRAQSGKNYISYVFSIGILAVLLYLLSSAIKAVGPSLSGPVLQGILSYGFLMVVGMIVLLGLPQVFKHLYSATDLALLFTMPIPTRHIFWVKYLQSFFGVPLIVFIFFITALIVYGVVTGASLLFYPVAIILLVAFIVIGLSIAYLFNLLLIQVVPASKANEFMTAMSVLSGVFIYLMFMIPNITNDRPLTEVLLSGLPLFPDWVPVSWASEAIIKSTTGSAEFLLPFVLVILLAVLLMMLTMSLVEKGFRTGWIKLSEGGGKKKKKMSAKASKRSLRHPVIAIGKKEWYAIKRDMREWLVFMPLLFFFVAGIFGFISGGASLSDLRGPNHITWPIAQAAFLFIYALFNGQLAASSVAREANAIWVLRILPISGKYIALGKLWISWLIPFTILTTVEIALGIVFSWTFIQFISGIVMKAFITIGISAIGLWLGTIGAKYNPANPQNRLKFSTGFILMITSYVYLLLALIPYILLIVPLDAIEFLTEVRMDMDGFWEGVASVVLGLLSWKGLYPTLVLIIGIIIMIIFSLGAGYIFTMASARNFDKGIEIEMAQDTKTKSLFNRGKTGTWKY
ncbi:hypothetical protein ACFO3D_12405 [Virgibacillus kekensis]|uniref:ABC transporter permease n=1 Tax=Virgibacillus kekensis TaxID=202261 RepID=A0ABV9DJI9_9BACI